MTADPDSQFSLNTTATRTQHGALCWRLHRATVQVLLVSSRGTGRWIIPKGWPIAGLGPHQTALREAWEEAGVQGHADELCLGLYPYLKAIGTDRMIPCLVSVYPVRVTRLRDRFPERKERLRKWFTPQKAAAKVDEPELRTLLSGFVPPVPGGTGG